jgi:putative PIN family toxin of toxin-antitoxin system
MAKRPALRVVLDTNTWLDLLWFHDPRCATLAAALADGRLAAVANAACRDEWMRVLAYPELAIDAGQRAVLAARFDATALVVDTTMSAPALPRCSDPDDQKFLELAHAAGAAALFTRDAAVLALAGRCRRAGLFAILRPDEAAAHFGASVP